MSQEEVSLMFSDGWVCFRAFNPETRAPMLLPTSLMPSVPTNSKSTWKNKDERAAIRAAKVAARAAKAQLNGGVVESQLHSGGAAPPSIAALPPTTARASLEISPMRLVRAPLSPGEVVAPPPALRPGGAPQYLSVEMAVRLGLPHAPQTHFIGGPASEIPGTPPSAAKKKPPAPAWATPMAKSFVYAQSGRPGQPKTQEAFDAKSGRGQHRRRSYGPVIPASQRCGLCKPCINPGWKKPCEVRRAEAMAAQNGLLLQRPVGNYYITSPPPPMQTPGTNGSI